MGTVPLVADSVSQPAVVCVTVQASALVPEFQIGNVIDTGLPSGAALTASVR